MSCPYIEFNWDKMCEECRLTKKPTNSAVVCDFGYDEECLVYQNKRIYENTKVVQCTIFDLENFNKKEIVYERHKNH